VTVVPEVVGDQDFDADLPLDHAAIITSDLARSRQLDLSLVRVPSLRSVGKKARSHSASLCGTSACSAAQR
jgi:hypothetical protein